MGLFSIFERRKKQSEIKADSVTIEDGVAVIDVRGQTCPGYLLAINKATGRLSPGMQAQLLVSYPPCADDVKAWCKARSLDYIGVSESDGMWVIEIRK